MKKMQSLLWRYLYKYWLSVWGGLDYDLEVVEEVVAISLQIVYIIYNERE